MGTNVQSSKWSVMLCVVEYVLVVHSMVHQYLYFLCNLRAYQSSPYHHEKSSMSKCKLVVEVIFQNVRSHFCTGTNMINRCLVLPEMFA